MEMFKWLLGIDIKDFNVLQTSMRALVIYVCGLIMIRIGDKRFIGKTTAFDFIFGIMIGSVLSRAINGSAALFPTIVSAMVLVALHWLLGYLALSSDFLGNLIKGKPRLLIEKGKINWSEMKRAHLSEEDLKLELRYRAGKTDFTNIETAYLERNGRISFIQYSSDYK